MTVTGVDDTVVDGDVAYTIVTAAAVSTDTAYNGLDALDVSVVNVDNDAGGLTVEPRGGTLTVSELGTTTNFSVVLNCEPAANVTVSFTSGDTTEGTVSPASRTFTTDNWAQPQSFTLTGVDDLLTDGTVSYTLNGTVTFDRPGLQRADRGGFGRDAGQRGGTDAAVRDAVLRDWVAGNGD